MLFGGLLFTIAGIMVIFAMWIREFESWIRESGKRKA